MACPDTVCGNEWRSVSVRPTPSGLTAHETFESAATARLLGLAPRVLGGAMLAGAVLVWFLADIPADPQGGLSRGTLGSFLVAAGVGLFAFGTSGFRRQIAIDTARGTLSLTHLDSHDKARVSHIVRIREIESVYLRRTEGPRRRATLLVRVAGQDAPMIGLTGATGEIEDLHRQICAVMHPVSRSAPRPEAAARPARRRKQRLFSA